MEQDYIGPLVLTSINYKRLKAIRIAFDEPGLTLIQGKNGQGKSSVLDSLLSVLLEDGQVDERPIREGEDTATVELTLTSGQKIRRTFKRDGKKAKGYTTELLLLTSDGGKMDRPAATIKEWLGSSISFDPLDFADMKPGDRRTLLAKMLGIDLDSYDARIRPLETKRTQHYGVYDAAKRAHENKPESLALIEPIDVSALSAELSAAMQLKEAADTARGDALNSQMQAEALKVEEDRLSAEVKRLADELAATSAKQTETVERRLGQEAIAAQKQSAAESAAAAIPDIAAIQERLAGASEHNRKADDARRVAQQREQIDETWKREQAVRRDYDRQIEAIREEKVQALAAAKYPVEGMRFGDDDVLLNGLPFSQASQAEQIKAGIGVALAFNPKLRIIVTHDASLLDRDNLKLLHESAKERNCFVIGEQVTDSPDGGFYIEDGEVSNGTA